MRYWNQASIIYSIYTIIEPVEIDSNIHVENFPYSIGDLSEEQLYKEYQIINGEVAHFESNMNEEAIDQLLSKYFESMPSY